LTIHQTALSTSKKSSQGAAFAGSHSVMAGITGQDTLRLASSKTLLHATASRLFTRLTAPLAFSL
jgi:hypothetical protein